ncbi:hypothetical protein ERUR111494_07130 [Erysipelothrix urinaevulpis]|uniref:hypothetical protein n=1 Tax=Erysipelothrix urinaevulpis TaxID=2683717 RepID=UPI0013597DFE|nr:hypothetical protein [Erysipelothrix urinaevulpis]
MYKIYESFSKKFKYFSDCFCIIGGTASAIVLSREGLDIRITKDYDIVIYEEARNKEFYDTFIEFLHEGKYVMDERRENENLYRFKTKDKLYPPMIELLCKKPDFANQWMGPIRSLSFSNEDSLSAIMLDDEYYQFIINNTEIVQGIPILNKSGLLILKAKAWYNLSLAKENNDGVTSTEVSKHIKDIARLVQLFNDEDSIELNRSIKNDMLVFLELLKSNLNAIPESRDYFYTREEVFAMLNNLIIK